MEWTERKKEILKAVVDAYIATGEPVGSKYVAGALRKPCSSATIRNEMADLEKMGVLEQPHTSAGRIPTRRGYRVYVDEVMEGVQLSFEETLLLNSLLSEARRDRDKGLRDLTKLLARMTGCAVVTFSSEGFGAVERFEGVSVHPRSFVLVMVTASGRAVTRQLQTPFPVDREGVAFLVSVLNEHLAKKELGAVTMERIVALENSLGDYRGMISVVLEAVYAAIAELGRTRVWQSGAANLFRYPEFADPEHARQILTELENEDALVERFAAEPAPILRVHVGEDKAGLDGASFVTCPFRLGKNRSGVIGIIGPRRMDYAGVMAKLEFLSKQMGALHGFKPALPLIETGNEEHE